MDSTFEGYYTPNNVAKFIVSRIPKIQVSTVADICAGSGSLIHAALNRWPGVKVYAVDINQSSILRLKNIPNIKCIVADGRTIASYEALNASCDVVLANPPFIKTDEFKIDFEKIIQHPFSIGKRALRRLEVSMIFANLALIRPNGHLAIILPDGLLNAISYSSLREFLVNNFTILEIVALPVRVFQYGEVKASFLIIKNRNPKSQNITNIAIIKYIDAELKIMQQAKIKSKKLIERMDPGHFLNNMSNGNKISSVNHIRTLKDLGVDVRRGHHSASSAITKGIYRIIHSTNIGIGGLLKGEKLFLKEDSLQMHKPLKCRAGDILIVRVGKTLGKVALITKKEAGSVVSDCLFRIRVNCVDSYNFLKYLQSNYVQNYFKTVARGSAASYITAFDILLLRTPKNGARYEFR